MTQIDERAAGHHADVAGTQATGQPFVFVTVGTDHHQFDRLIQWTSRWFARHPEVRALLQTGTATTPATGEAHDYLGHEQMQAALSGANVVVSHGGPATIMAAKHAGIVPIVVPRRHELGEHVDNHQVEFASWLAARSQVHLADSEEALHALLDRILEDPDAYRSHAVATAPASAVQRFGDLVNALLA